MAEIIYWTEQKIQETQKQINDNINKAEDLAEEEQNRMLDKMNSSGNPIVVNTKEDLTTVPVEGTQI